MVQITSIGYFNFFARDSHYIYIIEHNIPNLYIYMRGASFCLSATSGQVFVGHPYYEQQTGQVFVGHPYYEHQTGQVFVGHP